MTIGIGVLASEDKKPDHIVLVSDTMGSYEDAYSTSELHKGYHFQDVDLYAVAAGSIDRASEFMAALHEGFKVLPADRTYGDVVRMAIHCFHGYKLSRFSMEIGPRLMFTYDQWFQMMDPEFRTSVLQEWTGFDIGFDLIVGSFARNIGSHGQALLLHVSGQEGKVEPVNFPGVCAIGTGAENARFWMSYRKHKLSVSVKRAAYHAYEAKLMAEKSAHVNERVEMLIARVGTHFSLRQDQPSLAGCPVSLPELGELYKKYGAQDTTDLDPLDQARKPIYGT